MRRAIITKLVGLGLVGLAADYDAGFGPLFPDPHSVAPLVEF